jgi:hypothetical protein
LLSLATALGFVLAALGSVESLSLAALDLEQPRIRNLQRVARLVSGYGLVITAGLAFLFAAFVRDRDAWRLAPLAGVALNLPGPLWLRLTLLSLVAAAGAVFLAATLRSATLGAGIGTTGRRGFPRRSVPGPPSATARRGAASTRLPSSR